MSEIEKLFRDMLLGGVGVVAAAVEKADELAKGFVRKGQETMDANQETLDTVRRKGQEVWDDLSRRYAETFDATRRAMRDVIDQAATMTAEQRAEIRRRLDELDELEREASRKAAEAQAEAESEDEEKEPVADAEEKPDETAVEIEDDGETNG